MEHFLPFPQKLKYEREKRGWSQAVLAEHVQIDCKTIYRWEAGKSIPHPFYRQKLCEAFQISAEELGLLKDKPDSEVSQNGSSWQDWGEAPLGSIFYGRIHELEQLAHLIEGQRSQVIALLGIGGMGKTALAMHIAEQLKHYFTLLFWRSLQDMLPPDIFLKQCLQHLSGQSALALPGTINERINLLLQRMQKQRCLLILDNVESIMQGGRYAGSYQEGYEPYGRLIQRMGEVSHESCLILTSREKPKEVALLEGPTSPVRSFLLGGVGFMEGKAILKEKGIHGSDQHWKELVRLYSGNPLALKLVSQSLQELFHGDIALFIQSEGTSFGDIDTLIRQQVMRVSPQERELLYWLALEREAVNIEHLLDDLVSPVSRSDLLASINSLCRRCLVEVKEAGYFTLQPVIMEYMTGVLVKQLCQEFLSGADLFWKSYPLYKAQCKEYIRDSQKRLILLPIVQYLCSQLGKESLKRKVFEILSKQRQLSPLQHHYLASNLLKLLVHSGIDLRGADFSHLAIRQAHLQDMHLPDVNFAYAHFSGTTFKSTFGNVLAVTLSLHAPLLAMGTATGEVWTYHFLSGTPLVNYRGHTDGVWSLAFHPGEQIMASGSDDQTVRIWDVNTGECLNILHGHTDRVRSVTFSPDGSLLASGSDDQTARIWDIQTGECLQVMAGHTDRVWSVNFRADGQMLVTGSTDRTLRLWKSSSGECIRLLEGHTGWVRSVVFNRDGSLLASGSDDQTVRIWDVAQGRCLDILKGHTNRVWSLAFCVEGSNIVSGSEDQSIRLWNIKSRTCLRTFDGHTHGVRAIALSSDGKFLVSGGDDQTVRIWELQTGSCLKTIQGYARRLWSVAFNTDGTSLLSSAEDQSLRLWDLSSGICTKVFSQSDHRPKVAVFSPDGTCIASGGEDQTVKLWDRVTGQCQQTFTGHENWVRALAFTPDGKFLVSGGEDHTLRLWAISTPHCLSVFHGHTSWIRSLAVSFDGKYLASGGDDQAIHIWDMDTKKCLRLLQGHTGRIRSLAFHPNGKTLASGSEDHLVRIWDIYTGVCLNILHGHSDWIRAVAFSPDGQWLASGGNEPAIYLWPMEMEQPSPRILSGHTHRIRSLAFHPTDATLVSASDDGLIKRWSLKHGSCIQMLISERPYERMNITGASGLTDAQNGALQHLGAVC